MTNVEKVWFTVTFAVVRTSRGRKAILEALRSGELRGTQTGRGGTWHIHRDALDAWMNGEIAPVEIPVVTRRQRVS